MPDSSPRIALRPGVTNPSLWYPERPRAAEWKRIRQVVLERDEYTCCACGHRASKYMNVHHLEDSFENTPDKLCTICVACHAVLHIGRSLDLGVVEIWRTDVSQTDIVRMTRDSVRNGLALSSINASFGLKQGPYPPDSIEYANGLIRDMPEARRAYLREPLSAVFVGLSRWQIE